MPKTVLLACSYNARHLPVKDKVVDAVVEAVSDVRYDTDDDDAVSFLCAVGPTAEAGKLFLKEPVHIDPSFAKIDEKQEPVALWAFATDEIGRAAYGALSQNFNGGAWLVHHERSKESNLAA